MLDIKYIRENTDEVKRACEAKKAKISSAEIDDLLTLDTRRALVWQELEELRKKRNKNNELASGNEPTTEQRNLFRKVKEELVGRKNNYRELEKEINKILGKIPNIFQRIWK